MDKDRSITLRDALNSLIATLNGNTQEDEIMRCALSEAVESLERWIYDGNYTPSVRPADKIFTIKSEIHSGDKELTDDKLLNNYLKGRNRVAAMAEIEKDFGITQEQAMKIVDEYERTATPSLADDEMRLAKDGKKIDAIRTLKARTHIGLKRAKDLIEEYQKTTTVAPSVSTPSPFIDGSSEVTLAEIELCKTGKFVEAIRNYRIVTGRGLRESKDAVEAAFEKVTGTKWSEWKEKHKEWR